MELRVGQFIFVFVSNVIWHVDNGLRLISVFIN